MSRWFLPTFRRRPPRRLSSSFKRFLVAAAITNASDGIRAVALPLLAVAVTRDPVVIAGLGVAQSAPMLIAGLPAGVLADRYDRRRLVVAADVVAALLFVAIAGGAQADLTPVWQLYGIAVGLGTVETIRDTTLSTAVPALVDAAQLDRANGRLVSVAFVANQLLGPALGAMLFGAAAALPFGASAGLAVCAAVLIARLPTLGRRSERGSSVAATGESLRRYVRQFGVETRDGVAFLAAHRILRVVTVIAVAITFTDAAWFSVLVLFITDELGQPATAYGIALAVAAMGGAAGGLVADRVIARLGWLSYCAARRSGSVWLSSCSDSLSRWWLRRSRWPSATAASQCG